MTCTALVTQFGSGRCAVCLTPVGDGIEMHFVEDGAQVSLRCVDHCEIHAPKEWKTDVVTVGGEQGKLW